MNDSKARAQTRGTQPKKNAEAESTETRVPITVLAAVTSIGDSVALPITVFVLLASFHREITAILRGVTKLEYPGGSITVQLDRIQASVARPGTQPSPAFSAADLAE